VRRAALQWATRANEAYQVLKHPLSRARYLCELQGIDVATESNTEMSADFLMAQLAWRETLEDAARGADLAALEALDDTLQKAWSEETEALAQLLDQDQNYAAAAQGVRRLMFLDKTRHDVGRALDGLAA
jgi:molecular chaperone HscB